MHRKTITAAVVVSAALIAEPAFAHHVMGGRTPATLAQGLLSGLAHPVIGLDHLAAVVAVGCLAAAHRAAVFLVIGYIIATMIGVGAHLFGANIPGAELIVALTVIGLGGRLLLGREMPLQVALILFALIGFIHGYALGESIYGAERTPLVAYLIGLAVIQSVVALGAMMLARAVIRRADLVTPRLIGAGIVGVGLVVLMQQIVPAP
jgi:urease accessory protein